MRAAMRSIVIAATLLAPAAVAAEPLGKADRVHDFHSVDRLTPQTTFGLSVGYEVWDEDSAVEAVLGFDVAGHYVTPSGIGGYVVVPLSYLSSEDIVLGPIVVAEGDSELALGNIELGGMFARAINKDVDIVARLGVAVPTADDDGIGAFQAFASVPRYGDLVQRWPNSTWLRLGASPMGSFGPLFWRLDLGLDLALDEDDAAELSPVFRLNVAAGVDLGSVEVTGELANNFTGSDGDDDSASTLAIGARFAADDVHPGIAVIFPLGFDGLEDALDLAIAASVTVRLD